MGGYLTVFNNIHLKFDMKHTMAIGVQQHQVIQLVTTALCLMQNVVDVPPSLKRDVLIAHRTAFLLTFPKRVGLPFTLF